MSRVEKLRIEREGVLPEWETVAYPKNDIGEALGVLTMMRIQEQEKKHPRKLRLVRITHEVLSS